MKTRHLLCLLLGALSHPQPLSADKIDPADPPRGLFSDEWMVALLGGQRAGYIHTTLSRQDDRVTSRLIFVFKIARGGAPIEITTMESFTETVAGEPLSFESSLKMAAMTTLTRGRVRDGQVEVEKTQLGMTQTQRVPYPAGALMAWGLYAEQLRRGLTEGLSYQLDTYAPSMSLDQAIKTTITVGPRETIDLLGKPAQGIRTTSTLAAPTGSMTMISWVLDDGTVLKSEIQMMGIPIQMVRTDRQTAIADVSAPEFFVNTLVKADRKIDRSAARRIRYRLRVSGPGDPMPDLPVTGMQRPGPRGQDSIELAVTRQDHRALQNAGPLAAGDDLAEFLRANIWINSDDPQVIAMANGAVGDAKRPYHIADRLRRHVAKVIKEKNLNIGFASASEVCRNKEGDCSEHAVLLAALGRVHGIPSRVVMGLVYVPWFGQARDVFGFHMWTQFHIGGQWVDFDAAQGESDCNPTHIAIATSSLKSAALADMAFSLINIIGRLEIEVLEADPPTAIADR